MLGVKSQPAPVKVAIVLIALSASPVPSAEVDWPEVVVSQKLLDTLPANWEPTRPPTKEEPETLPVLYA